MRWKYTECYPGIFRPVIEITLITPLRALHQDVLIDSGADFCVFSSQTGIELGLDIQKGRTGEALGAGGKISPYYLHKIIMRVGRQNFEIEAGFMLNMTENEMPYGIAGQNGFFDNFVVKFDRTRKEIELEKRK